MTPPRLCVSSLLLLFALLSIALVVQPATGMGLRHLSTELETAVDEENLSTPRRLEAQEYMAAMQGSPPSTPYCYTENDFDYVGNDIGKALAVPYTQCCWLCHSTDNCTAWSWNSDGGGTCWFKSKRCEVVYKPGVKSAIVVYSLQPTCTLAADTDYENNDIGRADSATAGECCDKCKSYPRCRAFSWNTYRGGSCWFKSAKGSTIYNPGVQSAEVYPNDGQNYCGGNPVDLQYGIDYHDNDIGNVPSASVDGCYSICKSWSGSGTCRAFSWSNHNGGTCWLKSLKGTEIPNPGVISAVVDPNHPDCKFENGVDYHDNDIGNTRSPTAEGCCSICKSWSGGGCKAFSWSNYNGGTCWLKSAKGSTIPNSNVMSATVT